MNEAPSVIGKYRVLRRLGEGGMGAVYLAHDDGIDRDVAIKLLRADNDGTRRRFKGEAQSAGRLKHPNIVTVYDFGEFESGPYLVMEFVEGSTLEQIIEREESLSLVRRLWLLEQVCHGLSYAHRAGIVHRDIKPSNLMVDREGTIKVVDFGIARSDGRDLTVTGKVVGTPAYMAPEQIRGEPLDRRCDIFALGLVVFEFLSGRRAFTGDSDYAIANRIVTGVPDPFTYPNDELGVRLRAVIDKALAKDPDDRYQDAELLAADLGRIGRHVESLAAQTRLPDEAHPLFDDSPRDPQRGLSGPTQTLAGSVRPVSRKGVGKRWAWLGLAVALVGAVSALVRPGQISQWLDPRSPLPTVNESVRPENVRSTPTAPAAVLRDEQVLADPPAAPKNVPSSLIRSAPVAPAPSAGPTDKPGRTTVDTRVGSRLAAARSMAAAGDHEGAIKAFEELLTLDPQNAAAADGLADARRAKNRARALALQTRISEAEQKVSDGAYDEAIAIFDFVLKMDAGNPEASDGIARARKAKAAEDAILKVRTKKPPPFL